MVKHSMVRICLVIVMSIALSGCGVRFVYNQLDWLIPWYLDDYIELESAQEEQFQARLQAYLNWHRNEQLPQYARFLHQVAGKAEQGLSAEDIASIEAQTEDFAQALMDRLLNDLIDLLAVATDEQIDQLFDKLEQDNAKYRKSYIDDSADKQRAQRLKEVVRYAERWTGRLNADQLAMISDWAQKFQLMGVEIEQARLLWQQEFKRILSMRQDRHAYEKAFRGLIANPTFGRSQQLQEKLEQNSTLVVQLYLQLDKTLSDRQRQHMVKKLRSYADDFQTLSTQ
jgi:hypothetical protein